MASSNSTTQIAISIIVAGILISLAILFTGGAFDRSGKAQVVNNDNAPTAEQLDVPQGGDISIEDEPTLGDPNAKITMVEFTDYQCPFCSKYSTATFLQIKKEYIDTGKVFYAFKDFPLGFHPHAAVASEVANCAGDQDKYLEMHDKIFIGQGDWSGEESVRDIFIGYAKKIGLDTKEFISCLDSGKYVEEIKEDIQQSVSVGVRGTPSFLINGNLFVGAQPFDSFKQAIDSQL